MLAFRDFVPRQLRSPHFGLSFGAIEGDYETFADAVAAARAWLAEARPTVIQIETVVLPDIWERTEAGTTDAALGTLSRTPRWHQFVRVWYEAAEG